MFAGAMSQFDGESNSSVIMWKTAFFAVIALLSSAASAVDCPVVTMLLYDGETCEGTGSLIQLHNNTITQSPTYFRSYRQGHVNERIFDNYCAGFIALAPYANGGTPEVINEISSLWQGYNGTENYGPCINATNPQSGNAVNTFALNAFAVPPGSGPDVPSNCGPNDGTYVPSGGGDGSGQPPITTSPPTTTTPGGGDPVTTLPPNTTPSPTDTSAPNQDVQDAISDAQTTINSASSAAAAYAADPTNAALAEAAEDAIYDAMAANQDAINLASDYQANQISSDLDTLDNALLVAGVAAVAATILLTAVAANELSNAFNDVQNAAQAAAANAADGRLNPRPNMRRPPRSSQPPTQCTIMIEQADANLAEPTPDPENLPAVVNPASARKRDWLYQRDLENAIDQAMNLDFYQDEILFEDLPVEFQNMAKSLGLKEVSTGMSRRQEGNGDFNVLAASRSAQYCGRAFQVPNYNSYMSSGTGNTYSPIYSYYSANRCSMYDWTLVSAQSLSARRAAPAGSAYPNNNFATEHIYEIQQVKRFLEYARQNIPTFQQLYPNDNAQDGSGFCNDFVANYFAAQNSFAGAGVYDYSTSPLQQVYNQLEGLNGMTDEFVYLDMKINSVKGQYFALGGARAARPGYGRTAQQYLASISRTAIMFDYLNTRGVANIYNTVSSRIRQGFIDFGNACADPSADPAYQRFGQIDWAGAYDAWEGGYIDGIEANARDYISSGIAVAKLQLRQMRAANRAQRDQNKYNQKIRTRLQYQQERGKLRPSVLRLTRL